MKSTYTFQYNIPSAIDRLGKTNLFITCTATANYFVPNKGPLILLSFSDIDSGTLLRITDWIRVVADCDQIALEYFADTYSDLYTIKPILN